jgi:hypothetical protein
MDSFSNLVNCLEPFENEQFNILKQELNGRTDIPWAVFDGQTQILNGGIQFVSLKRAVRKAESENCSVIGTIGINYHQEKPDQGVDPKEGGFTRYLSNTIDDYPDEGMRDALNFTLSAYTRNTNYWTGKFRWASKGVEVSEDYILVVTNLSPFITAERWGDYKGNAKLAVTSLLKIWKPERHLERLVQLLSGRVDLWVGHGNVVESKFNALCKAWPDHLTPWLKTYNLSAGYSSGLEVMKKAQLQKNHRYHDLFK